jgi:hypothetical protein
MIKTFFADGQYNVQVACRDAWIKMYIYALWKESIDVKKKVLYNNL